MAKVRQSTQKSANDTDTPVLIKQNKVATSCSFLEAKTCSCTTLNGAGCKKKQRDGTCLKK
ncbi:MAG: hypothetical protein WCO35_02345 [Candidatus Nomurabacteria bacterium]